MKARMRRLSVSIDSSGIDTHQTDDKNTDVSESRIDRVKKLLSSPLTRRKSACNPSSSSIGSSSSSKVFGNALSVLAHRQYPSPSQQHACTSSSAAVRVSTKEPNIPYVMTRLCDFIERNSGLAQEGLFRVSGNAKLIDKLRHSFDASGDAPLETEGDVPSAAALLKLFLRELQDPVIPLQLHPLFLDAARDYPVNREESVGNIKKLVAGLPDENFYMLKYLSCFLNRVSRHEDQNRMNSSSLGIVFGPNLFRVSADDYKGLKEQALTNQVVAAFISDYCFIFEEGNTGVRRQPLEASTATASSAKTYGPLRVDIPVDSFEARSKLAKKSSTVKKAIASRQFYVIPLLTLNNDEHGLLSQSRKRKERRLSTFDSSCGRSCSEERPSPEMNALDIRRCNSSEEMSLAAYKPFTYCLSSETLLDVSPNPSMAKRRQHVPHDSCDISTPDESSSKTPSFEFVDSRKNSYDGERTTPIDQATTNSPKQVQCSVAVSKGGDDEVAPVLFKVCGDIERRRSSGLRSGDFYDPGQPSTSACSIADVNSDNEYGEEDLSLSRDNLVTCSVAEEAKERIPPLDVDTLHLNAFSNEPQVSEHRYSWPFINNKELNRNEGDDVSAGNNVTYPLAIKQNAAVQIFKKKSKSSYEAPISPSAFRSFLTQRANLIDPTIPPSPPVEQETILASRNKSAFDTPEIKEIKKRLHVVKRKLKDYEADFEVKHGYRPSYDQKISSLTAKPIITELARLRQKLKEMREDVVFSEFDNPAPTGPNLWSYHENVQQEIDSANSRTMSQASDEIENSLRNSKGCGLKLEEALKKMQEALGIKRGLLERPDKLEDMTDEQVMEEKLDLQKALLKFENVYGRPDSRRERDIMRPLYDRYRNIKRIVARLPNSGTSKDANELQPILENVTLSLNSPSESRSDARLDTTATSSEELEDDANGAKPVHDDVGENRCSNVLGASDSANVLTRATNFHELPFKELLKQLHDARQEKRHLRRVIKNFEDDFFNKLGRKVEKADRVHLDTVYNNYKHAKGKLRLLEALVTKSQQKPNFL